MAENKFRKQKLNKEDHKKVDDTAKNVRSGICIITGAIALAKFVPKVIKTITKA